MTTPKPDALTSNYCAHAAEHRMRDELPCPWCVIDELKRNRSQFAERLADCEISLGTFDPGAASEYWLKYAPGAMHVPAPETPQPVTSNERVSLTSGETLRLSDSQLAGEIAYLEQLRLNPSGLSMRASCVLLALWELRDRRAPETPVHMSASEEASITKAFARSPRRAAECRMTPVPAEPSNYPKPGAAQKATVRYPGMQICRKYTQNGPCLNEIDHQGECDGLPHL